MNMNRKSFVLQCRKVLFKDKIRCFMVPEGAFDLGNNATHSTITPSGTIKCILFLSHVKRENRKTSTCCDISMICRWHRADSWCATNSAHLAGEPKSAELFFPPTMTSFVCMKPLPFVSIASKYIHDMAIIIYGKDIIFWSDKQEVYLVSGGLRRKTKIRRFMTLIHKQQCVAKRR